MVRLGELMMILELHRQGVSVAGAARFEGRRSGRIVARLASNCARRASFFPCCRWKASNRSASCGSVNSAWRARSVPAGDFELGNPGQGRGIG